MTFMCVPGCVPTAGSDPGTALWAYSPETWQKHPLQWTDQSDCCSEQKRTLLDSGGERNSVIPKAFSKVNPSTRWTHHRKKKKTVLLNVLHFSTTKTYPGIHPFWFIANKCTFRQWIFPTKHPTRKIRVSEQCPTLETTQFTAVPSRKTQTTSQDPRHATSSIYVPLEHPQPILTCHLPQTL